jgi:hypothetical protein
MFPCYDESLVSVSTSILKFYNIDNPGHQSLKVLDKILNQRKPKNIVLMLFDGFGYNLMQRNLPEDSFLKSHIVRPISSTFPPTTVAATTAVASALYPIESAWLGWFSYFKEIDDIVTTFSNLRQSNGEPVKGPNLASKYMPYTSIGTRIHAKNPEVRFTEIATYLDEHLTLPQMASQIHNLLSTKERNFIYCYWPDPDHTMHEKGVLNSNTIKIERKIDNFIKKLTANKPDDTLYIIIADHGLIDTKYVYLKDYPTLFAQLKRSFSMENRAASLWVKNVETFKNEFAKTNLVNYFILYDKKTFLESGLLGKGTKHPMVDELVGDVIVIAKDKYSLAIEKSDQEFIGIHAGLTEDELLVPLIVV